MPPSGPQPPRSPPPTPPRGAPSGGASDGPRRPGAPTPSRSAARPPSAAPAPHDHPRRDEARAVRPDDADAPGARPTRRRKTRVPWFGRTRSGVSRKEQRFRLLKDVLGGILILAIVVAGLSIASGGTWPPLIIVESGSMMHPTSDTPYGRLGTIDVGDMLLVRAVDDPARNVRTWAEGGELRYGRPGDVIVFAANGDRANISIIHRAIAWVDVQNHPNGTTTYAVRWTDGQVLEFGPAGIYLPAVGLSDEWGFTRTSGYKPIYSGFLTKGDNAATNPAVDQAVDLSALVEPSWIDGVVYGEIPWLGLGRLATQTEQTNPIVGGWERVGNAYAPLELWTMFFLVVSLVIVIPLAWDTWKLWRAHRHRRAERRAIEEEEKRRERDVVQFEALPAE